MAHMESLKNCPELIPQNIGKGGRATVPLEKQLLLTHERHECLCAHINSIMLRVLDRDVN